MFLSLSPVFSIMEADRTEDDCYVALTIQGWDRNVQRRTSNALNSLAQSQEAEASSWGRLASDAAHWGLCDEQADALRHAQALRIAAMRLRAAVEL